MWTHSHRIPYFIYNLDIMFWDIKTTATIFSPSTEGMRIALAYLSRLWERLPKIDKCSTKVIFKLFIIMQHWQGSEGASLTNLGWFPIPVVVWGGRRMFVHCPNSTPNPNTFVTLRGQQHLCQNLRQPNRRLGLQLEIDKAHRQCFWCCFLQLIRPLIL